MKQIEIDPELYRYIASHTQFIGENASDILRRLLGLAPLVAPVVSSIEVVANEAATAQVFAKKHVLEQVQTAELAQQKGKVGRFLYLLAVLYQCHQENFQRVLAIRGRNRLYFATCEHELAASGNSTNPKEIPHSGYWVITNSNTQKKQAMLKRAAQELGYTRAEAEQLRDLL